LKEDDMSEQAGTGELHRHFGVWQATALNIAMIVGAGVFITIPPMLKELPGPYALLGWLCAGALILVDGLIWSELGAALPGSGGSYHYLLESFGRTTWGRLAAFLFIWQFLLSGPLELASGLIAIDTFSQAITPWATFNERYLLRVTFWKDLAITLSPSRLGCFGLGILLVILLYNRVTVLGRLTMLFCGGVLAMSAWILLEGWLRFDANVAFDWPRLDKSPEEFLVSLGSAMRLALYSYLGYYTICYLGDEVRDPGRTIPRAVLLSAALVVVLFVLLHLAMLGTISWHDVPTEEKDLAGYSLPAAFMRQVRGEWAVVAVTVCLIGSCLTAAFAGLLGYSRIPYGAARAGHFFQSVAAIHPVHRIPHVSLLLVGGMMLFWSFFDLQTVIDALLTTRILAQFVAQIVGVAILRQSRPDLPRPFRIWFYPLPCGLALAGWLYVYFTAEWLFILLGLGTLLVGMDVFVGWAYRRRSWPFAEAR
jgi:amino acid transporter